MTSRPSGPALSELLLTGTKYLCNLIEIERRDGYVLRFTDHDRTITLGGVQFVPVSFASMSADRREAALRTGNQEAYGVVDSDWVTVPDLLANRYNGAEVRHIVTNWRRPWEVIARHRKWIRRVAWTGSSYVATLEGNSQIMQRPAGGRFGGTFTTTCQYRLGDPDTCKADISADTIFGVRIATISRPRMRATFVATTWPGTFVDDYYRDGEIEWRWAPSSTSGVSDSPGTTTTLNDSTQSWTTDEHVGREVRFLSGTGGYVVEFSTVTGNTGQQLQFDAVSTAYGSGAHYDVCGFSANQGHISPVVFFKQATRDCTMLLPTPFPLVVGDSGIARPGCNGLFSTCKTKFSNQLNFGGDPFAPSALQVLKPTEDE